MRSHGCNLISVIVFISALQICATDFFSDKGSIWLSGAVNYSSVGNEDAPYRENNISFITTTLYFPAKFLFVGPVVDWNSNFNKVYSSNSLALGANVGFAYGEGIPVVPYFRLGGLFNVTGSSYYDISNTMFGFTIPIAGGVIIPLFDVVALQIEPAFYIQRIDDFSSNIFAISIGFCGLGRRSAVSFLKSFNLQ